MTLTLINTALHLFRERSDRKILLIILRSVGENIRNDAGLLCNILILKESVDQSTHLISVIGLVAVLVVEDPPVLSFGKFLAHVREHTLRPTDDFLKVNPKVVSICIMLMDSHILATRLKTVTVRDPCKSLFKIVLSYRIALDIAVCELSCHAVTL